MKYDIMVYTNGRSVYVATVPSKGDAAEMCSALASHEHRVWMLPRKLTARSRLALPVGDSLSHRDFSSVKRAA